MSCRSCELLNAEIVKLRDFIALDHCAPYLTMLFGADRVEERLGALILDLRLRRYWDDPCRQLGWAKPVAERPALAARLGKADDDVAAPVLVRDT